ncbi:ADP-ribosylation factor [Spatholobus suberectus]|nr:ADP-ribosylation factor [Spatholobus suberectus]
MLGLDVVGKTTILYKIHIGEVISIIPTIENNVVEEELGMKYAAYTERKKFQSFTIGRYATASACSDELLLLCGGRDANNIGDTWSLNVRVNRPMSLSPQVAATRSHYELLNFRCIF